MRTPASLVALALALTMLAALMWLRSEPVSAAGGSISGTVTDENTGEPLEDIFVSLYHSSDRRIARARTDASGRYSIRGLPTGDYTLGFSDAADPPSRRYITEWYNDQPDRESAGLVAVTANEKTAGIDAAVTLGGTINGRVTDEDTGEPLEHIAVTFSATYHSFGGGTATDASGAYSIRGLPADDYRLEFSDAADPPSRRYITEWYNDQPDRESADLVAITEKEKTVGIDAALALGGSINGTVTDENTGEPLERVCVSASDASHGWFGVGYTDASGNYRAGALPTGDYGVEFYDCHDGRAYEWYNDKPDRESADLVSVTQKEKTGGIDGALVLVTPIPTVTPAPGPAPTPSSRPPLSGPVFLSLGDSVLAGCCGDRSLGAAVLFNDYLSERLGEPVGLVNLATNSITSDDFIFRSRSWPGGGRYTTQLEEALLVLEETAAEGGETLVIALLIGGNDLLFMTDPDTGRPCRSEPSEACTELFVSTVAAFRANLETILRELVAAKDPGTLLMMPNYYNPFDMGGGGPPVDLVEAAVMAFNSVIAEAAEEHGAYLVDIHPLFAGRAHELIISVDPSVEGHRVIADAMIEAYESILAQPPATVTPFPTAALTPAGPLALPATGSRNGSTDPVSVPVWPLASLGIASVALALVALQLRPR